MVVYVMRGVVLTEIEKIVGVCVTCAYETRRAMYEKDVGKL